MNAINKAGDFTNEIERELNEIRATAGEAQNGLRVLHDLEMGWVAGGGTDQPLW